MRMKNWRCLAVAVGAACFLGACGNSEPASPEQDKELADLGQITVVTRESGSGTRSSFAQALGLDEEGVDDKVVISARSFVILPSSMVSIVAFSNLSANAISSWLPSSSPRFLSAPVHAKIVATELVDVSSPFRCL